MRARVVDVLAKLGPDAADAAEDLGRMAKESDGELRLKAITTLGLLGPAGKKGDALLVEVLAEQTNGARRCVPKWRCALTKMNAPEAKQAVPLLIKGLYVSDPTDAKRLTRQDKVSKILISIGGPAADPLAKTLSPTGDFYNSKTTTPKGMADAAARRRGWRFCWRWARRRTPAACCSTWPKRRKRIPTAKCDKLAQKAYKDIQ